MSEIVVNLRCEERGCRVAETRQCHDGHVPAETCPRIVIETDDELDVYEKSDSDSSSLQESDQKRIALPSGEALSPDNANRFLRWRPATLITIVGDRESGKSTIVCALYDRFLRGPFAGFGFTGSRTLVALERRSHYSRVDSGRDVADTPRTSISEGLHYFHFAVTPMEERGGRVDFLLSDRAGEVYRQARADADVIASLPEVRDADRLVLLMDGQRIANLIERANAMQSVRQTLRAFLDNDALGTSSIVQIITTKLDLIVGAENRAELEETIGRFERQLERDFKDRLRELTFWRVSARDPKNVFEPGYGMAELVRDWASFRPKTSSPSRPLLELRSEFDKLLLRTPLETNR